MSSSKSPFSPSKIIRFWFPVVLYSVIIFCVSSLPKLKPPIEGFNVDKILHIGEYIPFGFLTARALFHTNGSNSNKYIICLAVILAFIYGLSDEFHQSFVEGRYASIFDVAADTIGGFLGSLIYIRYFKSKQNQQKEISSAKD